MITLMRFSIGLLFLLLAPAAVPQVPAPRAQRRTPARAGPAYLQKLRSFEETPYLTRAVLRNGLTVLVHEFRAHPLVSITTYAPTGGHAEEEQSAGFSRILENMFFRATTTKPPGILSRDIRAMGGVQRSFSLADGTFHDLVVPSAQWKKALEVHANALLSFALDDEDLNREWSALLRAETAERSDPDRLAWNELMNVAFGQNRHAFRAPEVAGGPVPPSRERLLEFYRNSYDPARAILAVAGEMNASEVLSEVVRLYDRPKAASVRLPVRAAPGSQREFRYGAVPRTGTHGVVLAGFHVPSATAVDLPALRVLCAMLGTGEESILAHYLRDGKGAILRGEARLEECNDFGYLVIRMAVEPGSFDRSEIGLMTELELIKRFGPEEEDLERAKAQLEREFWLDQQTLSERAHRVIRYESRGDWKKWNQTVPQIRQLKPADIARVARSYLRMENCTIVESLPAAAEIRNVTAETLRSTLQSLLAASVEQERAERERETRFAIDLPGSPDAFRASEIRYPMRRASILRGPELFIQEDHALPLLYVGFFYPGGRLFEDRSNAGITALLLQTLLLAKREDEACRLRRQLEIYGGKIVPLVQEDCFGFLSVLLARHAEPCLEILGRLFSLPRLDKEDLARLKQYRLTPLPPPGSPGPAGVFDKVTAALYGDHPYTLDPGGTEAGIKSMTAEALESWYGMHVRNRKPLVAIIGDTRGTSLAGFFVKRYSGGRFQDVKMPDAFVKPPEKQVVLEEKWNGAYGMALVGFQAPPLADEDMLAMSVLSGHFAGPNGRLAEVLRERLAGGSDESLSYTARARGGNCILHAAVKPGDEQRASAAMEEEIRSLLERPISYRDFRAAVNTAVCQYLVAQQDRSEGILTLLGGLVAGVPLELMTDRAIGLQQVTEEQLNDVARRVFVLDKSVILRVVAEPPKP